MANSRWNNRKYVIISLADYTINQLEALVLNANESSPYRLRKSLDNSKAILKWDGDTPEIFDGMTTYSHSEIKTILRGDDWYNDEG